MTARRGRAGIQTLKLQQRMDVIVDETPRPSELDRLKDASLEMHIELGHVRMSLADVLQLGSGSIVELYRLAGEPVDLYAGDQRVARGELIVVEGRVTVRITEVASRLSEK